MNRILEPTETRKQKKGMSKKVSLKLLIDRKEKRVLYGEADTTFIDFLFTILALPVGTVVKLLSTQAMVDPLSTLFRSVDSLNRIDYFEPARHWDSLLKPKKYFSCPNRNHDCPSISTTYGAKCPRCRSLLTSDAAYVCGSGEARPIEGGYVKQGKFMVMDDLTVNPMPHSSMSIVSVLNELNVKDVGFIEEELVFFDIDEGVKLLKASLLTPTVLTDMFLRQIDFTKHHVPFVKKVNEKKLKQKQDRNVFLCVSCHVLLGLMFVAQYRLL